MSKRKIYICTTFREFNDDANSKIQELFLKSLAEQDYENWELVATSFGEKNIKATLTKMRIPFKLIEQGKQDYRFCLTDVVLNGIKSLESTGGVLVWTTADIIFPSNFLSGVNKIAKRGVAGTSHPHLIYEGINEYRNGEHLVPSIYEGFDLIFFDDSVLLKNGGKKLIEKYRFINWGVFEHFLVGVANICASKKINMWPKYKTGKIVNDRIASNDTRDYLTKSHSTNLVAFERFLKDSGQSKLLKTLVYCDLCFRPQNTHSFWKQFKKEIQQFTKEQWGQPATFRQFFLGQIK
jgi:hypothetical protein